MAGGSIDMLAIVHPRLFIQDASEMPEHTSRVSLHITTKKRVHINKCPQITGFQLNSKITFNNKHLNYVVFSDQETSNDELDCYATEKESVILFS